MSTFLAFTQFETTGIVYNTDLIAASGSLQANINAVITAGGPFVFQSGNQIISGSKTIADRLLFTGNGITAGTSISMSGVGIWRNATSIIDLNTSNLLGSWTILQATIGTLKNINDVAIADLENTFLIDTAANNSLDWTNRDLLSANGLTSTLNWDSRILKGGFWRANTGFCIGVPTPQASFHVSGTVRLDLPTTTSATLGGASTLPVLPLGYLTVNVTGLNVKVPYYSV